MTKPPRCDTLSHDKKSVRRHMILPGQFRLSDDAVADSLHAGGFGHLVTPGPETLEVTSMPLLYNAEGNVLEGHLARTNPHWRSTGTSESLVILPGADAYVSPEFYPSKSVHGKVVPPNSEE